MENSLQETAGSFSFCGMKKHAISFITLLISVFLIPLPASAEPVCEGNLCTITFGYTGSMQTWEVPQGAINLSFAIYGASGARGGGGGSVTGELIDIPDTLYIFVGGAGNQGVTAAGGYNGGGRAGGNRGNEGSGGGATDIRIGLELEDRIVVAGGGGGGGGYSGASGAAGGGLIANSGAAGQGGGGGGGTQMAGGGAGYSNGGSAASAGSFGQGGQGGTSWNAGGGGGGGGWYGGGGGGGDDDDCCADGGGGGGGSSYASTTNTQNVEHQIGVNSGHGRLVITYSLAPVVVDFSGQQLSSLTASFTLELSEPISGLTQEDLSLSTQSCAISTIAVDNRLATILVSGCSDGEVTLTLRAFSIGTDDAGPTADAVATLVFDGQGPSFEWSESPSAISSSAVTISFSVSDNLAPSSDSFAVSGCSLAVSGSAVLLNSCSDGVVQVSVRPLSLLDVWGNAAPEEPISLSFLVDTLGPTATWSQVVVSGTDPFSYSALLTFSEPVSFSPELVMFSSATDCDLGSSEGESGWLFTAACGYGSGVWSLDTSPVSDLLGNYAAQGSVAISFDNPRPAEPVAEPPQEAAPEPPAPEPPAPEPSVPEAPGPLTPTPVQPAPAAPEPVQQLPEELPSTNSEEVLAATESAEISPVINSDSVSAEVDEQERLATDLERELTSPPAPIVQSTPRPLKSEEPLTETQDDLLTTTESETASPVAGIERETPVAEPVIFEAEKAAEESFPWQIALAVAALMAAGALALRFSGR